MKTLIMILMSLSVGAGSTLLVQTVLVTPPPVVAVIACPEPDPDTAAVEHVLIEKALEPLPVDEYVPQGRFQTGLRTGREY